VVAQFYACRGEAYEIILQNEKALEDLKMAIEL